MASQTNKNAHPRIPSMCQNVSRRAHIHGDDVTMQFTGPTEREEARCDHCYIYGMIMTSQKRVCVVTRPCFHHETKILQFVNIHEKETPASTFFVLCCCMRTTSSVLIPFFSSHPLYANVRERNLVCVRDVIMTSCSTHLSIYIYIYKYCLLHFCFFLFFFSFLEFLLFFLSLLRCRRFVIKTREGREL